MSYDRQLILLCQLLWSNVSWCEETLTLHVLQFLVFVFFFFSVDFPALKFQWVREFSQMHFRDCNSRVIHHIIVRISSSSVIQWVQGCDSLIRTWRWYWRTLRLSSLPSSMFHNISCFTWSQSARRWCQIPWILEESWGWSFSSRWAFKNVSWSILEELLAVSGS